jgi:hypothetical protein
MDSTDEKIFRKQQIIREAEAREQSKRVQKELARRAFEMKQSGIGPDKTKSLSSADFQPKVEASPVHSAVHSTSQSMFGGPDVQVQELRSGERPKKAMQLGKGPKKMELL